MMRNSLCEAMSTKWACRCVAGAKWRWVADALAPMRRGKDSTWVQWKNFNFIISSPRGVFCSSAIQFYYVEYTLRRRLFALFISSDMTWVAHRKNNQNEIHEAKAMLRKVRMWRCSSSHQASKIFSRKYAVAFERNCRTIADNNLTVSKRIG